MLNLALVREVLGWCTLINMALLYLWFFLILFAHDWIFHLHHKYFKLLREDRFDALHYGGMAVFKLMIIVFNLTPYLALLIVT